MKRLLRLGLVSLLFAPLMSALAGETRTTCPWYNNNKHLAQADLLDGPIGVGRSVEPNGLYWNLDQTPRSAQVRHPCFYLICHYDRTRKPMSVELPRSVHICHELDDNNMECR